MANQRITYGPPVSAARLKTFLKQHTENNRRAEKRGEAGTPLCIWGEHGIGKTQIVEQFAKENGMAFAYLAPAQYEEMGDLAGLPELENKQTVFRPAAWVPRQTGPGILLIDDFNRADERILRGLMQLLQGYGLAGWQLPPLWQIILTANPDRGDYAVTPLDDAMLTRMLHLELTFQLNDWINWAKNNDIDPRALRFMQQHIQHLPKGRTTARSLTQLFRSIAHIDNWKTNIEQIALYAHATLDEETADAFIQFVQSDALRLPAPEEILSGAFRQIKEPVPHPLLTQMNHALYQYIEQKTKPLTSKEKQQLTQYLLFDQIPKDLRLALIQQLRQIRRRDVQEVLNTPEVLGGML